jgi:hypothetical protein
MDLKNDNELIQTLLNEIRHKVQDTLIQINIENNIDDNNNGNNEDDDEPMMGNHMQTENENYQDEKEFFKRIEGQFDPSLNRILDSSNEQLHLIRHKF